MSTDEIINKICSFFVEKPTETDHWVTHQKVKQTQKQKRERGDAMGRWSRSGSWLGNDPPLELLINDVLEIRAQEWRRAIADLAGCEITEVLAISPIDNVAIESFIARHRHTMPDADADRVRAAFRAITTGARYR